LKSGAELKKVKTVKFGATTRAQTNLVRTTKVRGAQEALEVAMQANHIISN
jgi:hypothetical protein